MAWILIGAAVAALLIVDWLVVMGADPRRWKGGRHGNHSDEL